MRLKQITVGACAMAMLFVSAKGASGGDERAVQVRFETAASRGGILIRVRVNDTPAVLILDTGSAHTILQPGVLGKAPPKLTPAREATNRAGFVGDAISDEVSLEVGRRRWKRRTVVIMDLSQILAAYDERLDGVLGLDFLQEFSSVVIDSKTKTITFKE